MKTKLIILTIISVFVFAGCELLEDTDPDSDIRDKLVGEWKVTEDSESFGNSFYNMNISKDLVDSTAVFFDNFYNQDGAKIKVIVDDLNLDIPDQSIGDLIIQEGYGSINSSFRSITVYYYVDLGIGERDVVRADYVKER